jgi:cytochrome c oxidase subunit 4
MGASGYLLTFAALIALATGSLLLSFVHWPAGDLPLSLVIALAKALLVLWFFMHLAEQRFSNRFVVAVSVLMVVLLVALASVDVATRRTFPARPEPPALETFYKR